MSLSWVWRSVPHSRPSLVMVALIASVLIITVFVTTSSQRHEGRRRRFPRGDDETGDKPKDIVNEIDGFKLSVCGNFKPRSWHDQQRAFGCKDPLPKTNLYEMADAERETDPINSAPRVSIRDLSTDEIPFYAHLVIESNEGDQDCAGTVVDYEFVVTTARCVYRAKRIYMVLGTSNTGATQGWNTEADKWCYLQNYHPVDNPYPDIAVLRIQEWANYSWAIQPACIAQHMQPKEGASCVVVRKKSNQNFSRLQGYVVGQRKCPAHLPELYEPNCYQANEDDRNADFCKLEQGTPVVCYDTCDESSRRMQAFVVAAESFAPTPSDQCEPGKSVPLQYTDLTRKSVLIRSMTHTLIDNKKYPTPSSIKCVERARTE